MKHKGLYFMVALALAGVGVVHAQDNTAASTGSSDSAAAPAWPNGFDDRWYIAPTVGGYFNDSHRHTDSSQIYYGLGFGKFISSNTSIDVFADRTSRDINHNAGTWASNNIGVAARYYFGTDSWRPYVMAGVLGSHHKNPMDSSWDPAAQVGVGIAKAVTDSSDVRLEAGYRYDWDDQSQSTRNGYGDWFLGLSIVSRIGAVPAAPAPVAPAPAPAPAPVQEAPAPQKVVIDLRGVNFKFDFPKKGHVHASEIDKALAVPTSDSVAILDQAVDTLKRYPDVHVTVAGYTDSKGTPAYNQSLSERRAQIVYDYLTSHGIDASRLEGPIGHGEDNPIGDNATDAGRAQNRRVELQVQQ
ncbi:OmpA family protein [Rhodanobacter sp. DHB23]|uniref:OmpA family protein n=1 Tax=Rhodanobacter sp. DHB23 TaxID=2775923 RepID=UPI00177D720B|nr:OmpA family protein [Rhodanobacter sp. DHB23]MBD8872583.1 OmpA family protein [Rhodanobacter sp. DHB23]